MILTADASSEYSMWAALRAAGFPEHAIGHAIRALFPGQDDEDDDSEEYATDAFVDGEEPCDPCEETGEWPAPVIPDDDDDDLKHLADDWHYEPCYEPSYWPSEEDWRDYNLWSASLERDRDMVEAHAIADCLEAIEDERNFDYSIAS